MRKGTPLGVGVGVGAASAVLVEVFDEATAAGAAVAPAPVTGGAASTPGRDRARAFIHWSWSSSDQLVRLGSLAREGSTDDVDATSSGAGAGKEGGSHARSNYTQAWAVDGHGRPWTSERRRENDQRVSECVHARVRPIVV